MSIWNKIKNKLKDIFIGPNTPHNLGMAPPKVEEKYRIEKIKFVHFEPPKVDDKYKVESSKRHHASNRTSSTESSEKNQRLKAIVGIDFGTSFTKAYCNVARFEKFAIQFDVGSDRTYFIPSVVFYDVKKNILSMEGDKSLQRIEYFKYGLLDTSLHLVKDIEKTNSLNAKRADEICSVFFMANVIKKIKKIVQIKCDSKNIDFSFNMGCPIDNFGHKVKCKYDEVLNLAYKLSNESGFESRTIDSLNDFIEKNKEDRDLSLQTIPELFAEALLFINDPSFGEGVYCILDVGGGTVDCATISVKWVDGEKKTRIYSQCVAPYGVEILLNKLYYEELYSNRNSCVQKLKNADVIIPGYSKDEPLKLEEHKQGNGFRTAFFQGVMDVKNKDPGLMSNQWDYGRGVLPYYAFGGGADFEWFHSIIRRNNKEMNRAFVPSLQREKVHVKLPDSRLVIAYQLSMPYFPDIEGFPWDFKKQPINNPLNNGCFGISDYGILDT